MKTNPIPSRYFVSCSCGLVAFLFWLGSGLAQAQPAQNATKRVDADQMAETTVMIEGSFGGIGTQLARTNGALMITGVFPGTPAGQAGLQAGSQITAINGIDTTSMSINDAVKLVRGPIGTEVALEMRLPDGSPKTVILTRQKVLVAPAESRLLEDGVLWIRMTSFDKETPTSLREALAKHSGAKGIVLDMRTNSGGLADAIAQSAGLLLPRNSTLWFFRSPEGRVSERKNQTDGKHTVPLVILTSQRTMGGELLVSALQRNGRATVIGQPTSGFMSVTPLRELVKNADGSSRYESRGFLLLNPDASQTNVVPNRVLSVEVTEADYLKTAREVLFPDAKSSATDRLKQVKALYEQGLISKEDYDKKVKEIMDSL